MRDLVSFTRLRVWYDEDSNLLGLEPHESLGYSISEEKIGCRILGDIPRGRFEAYWDADKSMFIADLNKKIG